MYLAGFALKKVFGIAQTDQDYGLYLEVAFGCTVNCRVLAFMAIING